MYVGIFLVEIMLLFLLSRALHKRLSAFFFRLTKSKKISVWLMAVTFFPGTLVHEMSHFLAALLTLAPVGEIDLLPKYQKKRIKLGSVEVGRVDPFRSFIIAAAPFFVGNLILFLSLYYLLGYVGRLSIYLILVILYLLLAIANTMFLSKKDFIGVWRLMLTLTVVYLVLYYCGIRIPLGDVASIFAVIEPVFVNIDLFLLFPIIADSLVVVVLTLLDPDTFRRVETEARLR